MCIQCDPNFHNQKGICARDEALRDLQARARAHARSILAEPGAYGGGILSPPNPAALLKAAEERSEEARVALDIATRACTVAVRGAIGQDGEVDVHAVAESFRAFEQARNAYRAARAHLATLQKETP